MLVKRIIKTAGILTLTFMVLGLALLNPPPLHASNLAKKYAGKNIRFLVSQAQVIAARYLAEKFHQKTGVVVEIIHVPYRELGQSIMAHHRSESRNVDVVMLWYIYLGKLVEENMLVDLTDFIKNHESLLQTEDLVPSIFDAYTLYRNRRWGLPFDGDTHVIFYNKTIFKRHALTPPQTWDDFLRISRTVTEKDKHRGIYGNAIMAEQIPVSIVSVFMNRLTSYGGRLLDEKSKPQINTPEAIAALKDIIDQSSYAIPTPQETDFDVCIDLFLSGRVAMVEQWTDIGIMAEDETKSRIAGQWGVVPIPIASGDTPHVLSLNAGHALAISSKTRNRDLAEKFILFASSPETALELNLIKGGSGIDPVRFSTIHSKSFSEFAPQISALEKKWLAHSKPWPKVPQMPEMIKILAQNLRLSLDGVLSPEKALAKTHAQWMKLLSE